MSQAAPPPPPADASPPRRLGEGAWGLALLLALTALTRPYQGIVADARLYVGSALAALDPAGIGRDLMFQNDGQFGFSLFPPLLTAAVGALGPAPAALLFSMGGLIAWTIAVAALCLRLAGDRRGWWLAACVIVLLPTYGAFDALQYGEAAAVPRPWAEAGVLAGLAALLGGRRLLALGLLAAGAAMHPIMALPGLAIALGMLIVQDRRWIAVPLLGAPAVLIAAVLGLPMADRLLVRVDPEWLEVLQRSPYLFPSLWHGEAWSLAGVQAAALTIGAALTTGRVRVMMLSVLAVAAGGVLVSALAGDHWPLLLVVQVQTWRALWLLALFANLSLGLAALRLWREGPALQLALALLVIAWTAASAPLAPLIAAGAAGLVVAGALGRTPALSPRLGRAALIAAGLLAAGWVASRMMGGYAFYAAAWKAGVRPGWDYLVATGLLVPALLALSAAALVRPRRGVAPVVVIALVLVALPVWDARPAFRRMADAQAAHPQLTASIPAGAPVLWVGGADGSAWFLAHRPDWTNTMQGAGVVFSRPLAMGWRGRMARASQAGLMAPSASRPFSPAADLRAKVTPTAAGVQRFCAEPDAPAAIIIPELQGPAVPQGWTTSVWRAPAPEEILHVRAGRFEWRREQAYTVLPCRSPSATPRP